MTDFNEIWASYTPLERRVLTFLLIFILLGFIFLANMWAPQWYQRVPPTGAWIDKHLNMSEYIYKYNGGLNP